MNFKSKISLFAAILSIAALPTARAFASDNQPALSDSEVAAMQSTAAQMVLAQAALFQPLDAAKIQPGQQFKATLKGRVKLKNGTLLPSGTELVGTADSGEADGKSTLTLHFTQAQLKDGKSIPIVATIVYATSNSNTGSATDGTWTPSNIQISQQNVIGGVELKSRIGGSTSGTFLAVKKDKLKLGRDVVLLAIGAA
jgi:hypothetical protein